MTRVEGIPAQTIKVATATRSDLLQYVLGGIYLAAGSSSGRARVWVMAYPATIIRELEFSNTSQKDDSISLQILPDGAVMVTTSEAGPDNSGASSQPVIVQIAGVFPPAPTGGSGGGGGGSTTNVDQTARDMATAAQNTANQALSTANSAKSSADAAKSTANAAKSTADQALAKANSIPIWPGADVDWQQAINAQYAELTNHQSGSYNELIRIINEQIDKRLPTPSGGSQARSYYRGDDDDPEKR
jgi:Alanine-zipper, major outer membrane lipoprotein